MAKKIIISLLCLFFLFPTLAFGDTPDSDVRTDDTIIEEEIHSNLRVTSTDANGFHGVIIGLIGDYEPIVKDYTYQNTQGYWSHTIEIQPDWSWIASCAIFALVFFCFMLFIGKLFTR